MDGFLAGDDEDCGVFKKPAGQKAAPLAITDEDPPLKKRPAAAAASDAASSTSLKKRPAASSTCLKKPAAVDGAASEAGSASPLTEANVEDHNAALQAQNGQVNVALENSMKQVQAKMTLLAASKQKLLSFSGTSSQVKIKAVIEQDLAELEQCIDATMHELRQAYIIKFASTHIEDKVTLLNKAAAQISELASLAKSADQLVKQK